MNTLIYENELNKKIFTLYKYEHISEKIFRVLTLLFYINQSNLDDREKKKKKAVWRQK